MSITRITLIVSLLLWVVGSAALAEPTVAVTEADIDQAQCKTFVDGKELAAPSPECVLAVLGLHPDPAQVDNRRVWWTSGEVPGKDRHFRIAFTQPITLGSLCTTYTGPTSRPLQPLSGQWVSYLKADAPYPGDVMNEAQWVTLPAGMVKTLPPGGVKTRALRFTERSLGDTITPRETSMGRVTLFQERYYSALNIGNQKRYGKEKTAETWLGTWSDPQTVVGILFFSLRTGAVVEALKSTATVHALVASNEDWRHLPDVVGGEYRLYPIAKPVATRAIRIVGGAFRWDSNFPTVIPLVNLGDAPEVPSLAEVPAPFKVKYNMPFDGFAALEVHDKKTGALVRRVVGEVAREKGPVQESWDLKDESGNFAPPGDYTLKGIARPPFTVTWQTSVYNSGQPAWWAPAPGKGGGSWMADHTPPDSAEAMGDIIWLGSQVTENGNCLIAVDKEGNKLWGEHAVSEGFSGPERIAADGHYGYLVNDTLVQRVDPKDSFKVKTVFQFHHTLELPGNGQHWDPFHGGAVATKDKLYVSFYAPTNSWLKPSFISEAIDPKRSVPMAYLKKGNGRHDLRNQKPYNEGEYDELMKVYAAFLTDVTPDGASIPSSTQACFGDAPTEGPLSGSVIVAFKTPIVIGSLLLPDAKIKVQALKPGMDLPEAEPEQGDVALVAGGDDAPAASIGDDENWVSLPVSGKPGRPGIALAPEGGITTKALRFQVNRLTYALVMARRFEDIAAQAERVYLDGATTPHDGWTVTRPSTTPISEFAPAIMGLVWPAPTEMRGISLHMPTSAVLQVDRWIGPAGDDPKKALADDTKWETMGELHPGGSWWTTETPTLQSLDFGDVLPIRALRFRATAPAGSYYAGIYGSGMNVVTEPHRAGFDAIVAWKYLGGDPNNLPHIQNERVEEFQLPDADGNGMKITNEIALKHPGNLAVDKAGVLHAISDGQVVTVPLDGSAPKVVVAREKLEKPSDLSFGPDNLLYVADFGPKIIKVFDPKTGAQVRTIGVPGGQRVGPWDPLRFDAPSGLTVDDNGKVWVCDHTYQPKRVERLSADGKVEKIFLGPTGYGGGGIMDPRNKSVVNYNGMKFVIDWKTYDWKLDSILFRPGNPRSTGGGMPDRVFYVHDKRYLVDVGYWGNPVAVICREENGVAIPMAAMGNLGNWSDVGQRPDLRKKFGPLQCKLYSFVWWDKHGDGVPRAEDVQIVEGGPCTARTNLTVGEDLAFIMSGWRLRPSGIKPDGQPMYDIAHIEEVPTQTHGPHESSPSERVWGTEDGRTFVIGDRLIDKDGKTQLWEYFDRWAEHEGFYHSQYGYDRPPGVLNQEHSPIGHFYMQMKQGNKEEFFVTNSDQGDLFCFTGDGMLAGCLLGGPAGYGQRRWTMPEWEHNKTQLIDVRLGQEHYQGWAGTAEDGKLYVIAGHNHASVVRVDGLEDLQRLPNASISVTPKDVADAQAWDIQRLTREKLRQEPKVAKIPYLAKPMEINGSLNDWPDDLLVTIHDELKVSFGQQPQLITYYRGGLAYDNTNLYVVCWSKEHGQLRNTADEPMRLFKSGDAVDVTLGLDPNADPKRTAPVAGDLRILISRLKDKPVVVIYRPVVPGTPAEKQVKFASPVGQTTIDVVKVLEEPQVAFGNDGVVEAAIPWKELGVAAPQVGTKIRGDIGVLIADQNGVLTAERRYWSGKSQTMVCDVPGEARLAPSLWGELYCTEPDKGMMFGPSEVDVEP